MWTILPQIILELHYCHPSDNIQYPIESCTIKCFIPFEIDCIKLPYAQSIWMWFQMVLVIMHETYCTDFATMLLHSTQYTYTCTGTRNIIAYFKDSTSTIWMYVKRILNEFVYQSFRSVRFIENDSGKNTFKIE